MNAKNFEMKRRESVACLKWSSSPFPGIFSAWMCFMRNQSWWITLQDKLLHELLLDGLSPGRRRRHKLCWSNRESNKQFDSLIKKKFSNNSTSISVGKVPINIHTDFGVVKGKFNFLLNEREKEIFPDQTRRGMSALGPATMADGLVAYGLFRGFPNQPGLNSCNLKFHCCFLCGRGEAMVWWNFSAFISISWLMRVESFLFSQSLRPKENSNLCNSFGRFMLAADYWFCTPATWRESPDGFILGGRYPLDMETLK